MTTEDAAEELRAAVRAVERGERDASSFYTRPPDAPAPSSGPPGSSAGVTESPSRADSGAGTADGAPDEPAPVPQGLADLLMAGGAPASLAGPAAAALGPGAADLLRADPWRLLAVPGVLPEQADGFAQAHLGAGCGPDDERRVAALVGWLLERAARAGHTVADPSQVARGLARHAVSEPESAVRAAIATGAVLAFHDPGPHAAAPGGPDTTGEAAMADTTGEAATEEPGQLRVGLERYALAEESLADGLARLRATFAAGDADWEPAATAAPSPSAAALIRAAAGHALVAHTGGEAARGEPVALVTAARTRGLRAWVAAHTPDGRGRAAAAEGIEGCAVTVTGLLAGREGPERDAEGLLAVDLLAVLDAPQLSAEAAAALVESLPDGARLVLSGDPHVLGAAGPGEVLADVLAAGICPHVASRTPDPGPLGTLVAGVAAGELRQVPAPDREVVVVPVGDAAEAVHRTVQLVTESIPRAFAPEPGGIQVLTPAHGGAAGTRALNAALKERLNPGPGRFGGFDPGDRVAYGPAPGHTRPGTVTAADGAGLHVECAGASVTIRPERVADTVRHGWAMTAHQAAGTRWPAVVVVVPGDAGQQVDRSWVHTAFGRAARHLSVVQGAGPGLARAVEAPPAGGRTTRLATLLRAP